MLHLVFPGITILAMSVHPVFVIAVRENFPVSTCKFTKCQKFKIKSLFIRDTVTKVLLSELYPLLLLYPLAARSGFPLVVAFYPIPVILRDKIRLYVNPGYRNCIGSKFHLNRSAVLEL